MSTISAYTGDGSTTQFDITFPYRDASTVRVSLDGVETGDFTFVNPSRIEFTTAPANGVEIKIFRRTPVDTPVVEFEDGAIIRGDDLNAAVAQPRERVEEIESEVNAITEAALKAPVGEALPALPSAEERVDGYLAFGAGGAPIIVNPPGSDLPLRADLASTDPGKGAALPAFKQPYADAVAETLYDVAKRTVWIEQFGAVPDDPGVDNHDAILAALYSGAKLVLAGEGTFYTSPIFVGRQADGVRFQGKGYSTCLSLIGSFTGGVSSQRALISIPAAGDPYGGTFEGAHNFTIDQMRLYGGDATTDASTATVGFRSHSQNGGGYGTLWTHGFTKHGVLVAGEPTKFDGGTLYTYDNGNAAGLTTSAQGIGIGCPTIADPTIITFDRIISWDNGIENQGFAVDFSKGSCTVGQLVSHGNGLACFKVAGPSTQKVIIGSVISDWDSDVSNPQTPAIYSNGEFELLSIGSLSLTNYVNGAGLSFKHNGTVQIGTAYLKNIPASSGADIGGSGLNLSFSAKELRIIGTGNYGAQFLGDISVHIGLIHVEDTPNNQGVYSSAKFFHADRIETVECHDDGTAVLFLGTPDSVFVGEAYMSHSTRNGTAMQLASTVTTARIISAKRAGAYTATILDSAGTNIKPFSVAQFVAAPSGGTTVDVECRAQLAALIAALQAANHMATS